MKFVLLEDVDDNEENARRVAWVQLLTSVQATR